MKPWTFNLKNTSSFCYSVCCFRVRWAMCTFPLVWSTGCYNPMIQTNQGFFLNWTSHTNQDIHWKSLLRLNTFSDLPSSSFSPLFPPANNHWASLWNRNKITHFRRWNMYLFWEITEKKTSPHKTGGRWPLTNSSIWYLVAISFSSPLSHLQELSLFMQSHMPEFLVVY